MLPETVGRHRCSQPGAASAREHTVTPERQWTWRLALWAVVLTLANVLADVAIGSPLMVLPQLLQHFDTDQAAWLNASAMLSGRDLVTAAGEEFRSLR